MLTPKILRKVILDQVVNKHSLGRHLTGFFIPNEDLPLRNRRLITIGLEVINIRIKQAGESLAFALQIYL